MDRNRRQRGVYATARQKKKLIELMTRHPELISCKVTQDFSYRDSQKLWHSIATECNSIPGARKTWRQWRKTWQDLRSKTKKRQAETNGELPDSVVMLTTAEQEALGLKNVSSTTSYQENTEFIPLDPNIQDTYSKEEESNPSFSDTESLPEEKIFVHPPEQKRSKLKNKHQTEHNKSCVFNCDMLAVQEQRKFQLKEDYLNFKKEYLRQKLNLMKEQTEALKSIAKELCVNK